MIVSRQFIMALTVGLLTLAIGLTIVLGGVTALAKTTSASSVLQRVPSIIALLWWCTYVLAGVVTGWIARQDGIRVGALLGVIAVLVTIAGQAITIFNAQQIATTVPLPYASFGQYLRADLVPSLVKIGLTAVGGWFGTYLATERLRNRESTNA